MNGREATYAFEETQSQEHQILPRLRMPKFRHFDILRTHIHSSRNPPPHFQHDRTWCHGIPAFNSAGGTAHHLVDEGAGQEHQVRRLARTVEGT
jgi:hypothetical protein